jgi:Spy/CpxP family protein refolding chaperone
MATATLTVAALALALPAFAGEHGRHSGRDPGGWIERHADELGLDDATLAEVEAIVEQSREEGRTIREEHRAARDAMHEMLEQDEPDVAAVMRQTEVIGEIDVRKHKHRLATMLAIRAKLTPEQRAKLSELREEMRDRRGKHHRKHGTRHRDGNEPGDATELE